MQEKTTEILIVGGGLGGVAAALAALRMGRQVILTEPTDWIGGQLTSQAVPPDEHPWIESTGCTASYRHFAQTVRSYYRQYYPLTEAARQNDLLNPGLGLVSRLCHEPRVALAAMQAMLAPYQTSHQLEILLEHRPTKVEMDGDDVRAVTVINQKTGEEMVIQAPYVLDASELGDLLELGQVEYIIGAESQAQTGEPHALAGDPDPLDQQAVSWCFAMDYLPGEDHTIDKPEDYDFWRTYQPDFWPDKFLSWYDVYPHTLKSRYKGLFDTEASPDGRDNFTRWEFRRILYKGHYPQGTFPSDITLVNWPQIDYFVGPLLGVSEEEKAQHLRGAMQLSLSMLYWMQTDAPRHDGGYGYPGLRLRGDVTGTEHGLAKEAYIREARRIQSELTITENHIGVEARQGQHCAEPFADSVGVGSYRIDLHMSTAQRNYIDISNYPFQVPLGALIPVRVNNLLPACKNIGTTHITNGCYRLHPVEWNIGEAAGALAAYCLNHDKKPRQVRNDTTLLADFQHILTDKLGFVLEWPAYARGIQR
ncbi:FAD-dependent oxidoreductase [Phototrophicus methaneseepsis]|uniref:FAD-dependent oxidoreductase n=1 Tax=Phototrophicus methaneseepsis TaxID=2710758 RepID=A0A7S8EAF8_9CHLR|nr:FAD-dependent oxidoreductase [Phototrophicus methaneseepsis]QPC83346.1 FAD-dependent oxidoreductase [Phototrophicus methaneseepsis]